MKREFRFGPSADYWRNHLSVTGMNINRTMKKSPMVSKKSTAAPEAAASAAAPQDRDNYDEMINIIMSQ